MDLGYCHKVCPKGITASSDALATTNSTHEAVSRFWSFADECFKTCPHKDKHEKSEYACKIAYREQVLR